MSNVSVILQSGFIHQMQLGLWAARYNTWLLIKLMPKGVVFPFLSFLFLSFPFLSFPFLSFPFPFFSFLLGLFTYAHVSHISSSGRLTECAQGMGQSIACGGGVDSGAHPH